MAIFMGQNAARVRSLATLAICISVLLSCQVEDSAEREPSNLDKYRFGSIDEREVSLLCRYFEKNGCVASYTASAMLVFGSNCTADRREQLVSRFASEF